MAEQGGIVNPVNTQNVTTDFTSPYYMIQNESPGSILVSEVMNGANYHQWSRAMMVASSSKNKEQFIDDSLPKPAVNDPHYKLWCRCNKLVFSWIIHSLDPAIKKCVLWMETANEVWKDLKKRFYEGDVFRISDLQEGNIHAQKR